MISSKPFSTILSENADQLAFDAGVAATVATLAVIWVALRAQLKKGYSHFRGSWVTLAAFFWIAVALLPALATLVYDCMQPTR